MFALLLETNFFTSAFIFMCSFHILKAPTLSQNFQEAVAVIQTTTNEHAQAVNINSVRPV